MQGLILSNLKKIVKEAMKFVSNKKLCVLKVSFLKMFILVNLFHKMLLLLRSGNDGALLQARAALERA